jgi:APA family basic amino acid/polyamine antiporter
MIVCGLQMFALPFSTWLRLIIWMALGMVIYLVYGRTHSKLRNKG